MQIARNYLSPTIRRVSLLARIMPLPVALDSPLVSVSLPCVTECVRAPYRDDFTPSFLRRSVSAPAAVFTHGGPRSQLNGQCGERCFTFFFLFSRLSVDFSNDQVSQVIRNYMKFYASKISIE